LEGNNEYLIAIGSLDENTESSVIFLFF
jgi:hypothetical protein